MKWGVFWTVVGAVAGVIGAGAAIYPLLIADQKLVHLITSCSEKLVVGKLGGNIQPIDDCGSRFFSIETLSEPVILTGNVYLKPMKGRAFAEGSGIFVATNLRNRRVPANDRVRFYDWPDNVRLRSDDVASLITCPTNVGEFEFGVEFLSKGGASWARARQSYCFEHEKERSAPAPESFNPTIIWPAGTPGSAPSEPQPKVVPPIPAYSAPAPITAPAEPVAPAPKATAPPPATAPFDPARRYVAVLSSKKSRLDAINASADLQRRYGDVLGNMTPAVVEIDLGDKGAWYRAVVGPFYNRDEASALCLKLRVVDFTQCWVTVDPDPLVTRR
jgi:SPOR domain